MAQNENKDQTDTRSQIANDLRQRATATQAGEDPVVNRMYDCLVNGAGARILACEAYRIIADVIEAEATR